MSRSTPRWCGRTSTRRERGKGGCTGRAARQGGLRGRPTTGWLVPDGLSTEIHLSWEQRQKPLSIVITAGAAWRQPAFPGGGGRYPGSHLGPGRLRTRPDRALGDKAHGSRANRPGWPIRMAISEASLAVASPSGSGPPCSACCLTGTAESIAERLRAAASRAGRWHNRTGVTVSWNRRLQPRF